jgi:ABC-type lipoprotein export system ATPase subunit
VTELAVAGDVRLACRGVGVVHRRGDTEVRALSEVDVAINPHDRLALLGRSGSGKTTLLQVLGGLLEPTEGTVDGPPRHEARREGIGYVFQSANLLPNFTAFENVAFAQAAIAGDGSANPDEVAELLGLMGLEPKVDHLPSQLSGGEAQRVAIARALAQEPAVLLCDEPTGHLDSETGQRVLDLLDALQEERHFALVVATHDPDVAARLERTLELHDGRVVALHEQD